MGNTTVPKPLQKGSEKASGGSRRAKAALRGLVRIADWLDAATLEIDLPWCVVVARQGREKSVQAELAMAGWATYLPMQTCWAGDRGRRRRVNRPLFARYLFAACAPEGDLAAPAGLADVQAVRRSASGRSIVCPTLLGALMRIEAMHGLDLTYERPRAPRRPLVCGETVTVRAGVLEGFDVLIVKVLSDRAVVARVSVFGGVGEATFRAADLEPVASRLEAA